MCKSSISSREISAEKPKSRRRRSGGDKEEPKNDPHEPKLHHLEGIKI